MIVFPAARAALGATRETPGGASSCSISTSVLFIASMVRADSASPQVALAPEHLHDAVLGGPVDAVYGDARSLAWPDGDPRNIDADGTETVNEQWARDVVAHTTHHGHARAVRAPMRAADTAWLASLPPA